MQIFERTYDRLLTILLSISIASSSGVLLGGCSSTGGVGTAAPAASSVYDRVMKAGKIRCGYVVYSPGCLKDPNTAELSGIGIDVLKEAAKNLGLEVEFAEEVGWGTMIEGLETNRYDIIATPIWTNSNRARVVDFSKPMFYSPIFAYVKAGGKKINAQNFSSCNNPATTIATVDGETAEIIAREDFPNAKKESLPQLSDVSQLMLTVSTGKADLTFAEPAIADAFLKTNPGSVERLSLVRPVRTFGNSWVFKRGQMEFKNMLDTALEQLMNSGVVDRIVAKYETSPGTLYRVARAYEVPSK
jgi:ABC-type amino acid transport/signal transduction systems, periplasmic component/domain